MTCSASSCRRVTSSSRCTRRWPRSSPRASASSFCSKNIPTPANDNTGQNWTRTNVPEVDPLLEQIETSLDRGEQAELAKQADAILAENMVVAAARPAAEHPHLEQHGAR